MRISIILCIVGLGVRTVQSAFADESPPAQAVLVSNTAVVTQKGFKKYRKQLVKLFAPFPYEYMNDAKVTPSEESKCKRAIEKAWADPSFGGARKVATIVDDASTFGLASGVFLVPTDDAINCLKIKIAYAITDRGQEGRTAFVARLQRAGDPWKMPAGTPEAFDPSGESQFDRIKTWISRHKNPLGVRIVELAGRKADGHFSKPKHTTFFIKPIVETAVVGNQPVPVESVGAVSLDAPVAVDLDDAKSSTRELARAEAVEDVQETASDSDNDPVVVATPSRAQQLGKRVHAHRNRRRQSLDSLGTGEGQPPN